MNAEPNVASQKPIFIVGAAAFAAVIALSILWAVVALFQSRGAPMERLAAAERACTHHAYQSEREACMQRWLDDTQATRLATH
jgi:hypothetical protein